MLKFLIIGNKGKRDVFVVVVNLVNEMLFGLKQKKKVQPFYKSEGFCHFHQTKTKLLGIFLLIADK